jgi:hypothetical protein
MDYYQGIVAEYLRADRAMFVNTELCIQLNIGDNPDTSGPHWYCDIAAVNFRDSQVFLCEVTFSKTLDALFQRLSAWSQHWPQVCAALARDCYLPSAWPVRPWLFVPEGRRATLTQKLAKLPEAGAGTMKMPVPKITDLESVVPWKYCSWDRKPEIEPVLPAAR